MARGGYYVAHWESCPWSGLVIGGIIDHCFSSVGVDTGALSSSDFLPVLEQWSFRVGL